MVGSPWRSSEVCCDRYAYNSHPDYRGQRFHRYRLSPARTHSQYIPPESPLPTSAQVMLRTRQYPEVAGIYGCEEQPALRRFTRYNPSMIDAPMVPSPQPSTAFSKSSKKPSFFSGHWTFRDRKESRPGVVLVEPFKRDERRISTNLSEVRGARSMSESASRQVEIRVPVKIERSQQTDEELRRIRQLSETAALYKTEITVDDATAAVMRPKKEIDEMNNSRCSYSLRLLSNPLRRSCPDLESAVAAPLPSDERGPRQRNRRAKEKMRDACWRRKPVEDWILDDVLLWLQACGLDDVASLLIGYDIKGTDLLSWNHSYLSQVGVKSASIREKILNELTAIRHRGPEEPKEATEKRNVHRALFDIVRKSAYDQVLAVETPLTTRDIIVTHGRLGCLQITKVNGVNLPLKENDCLLEINDCPGEQYKSALMLTKLISDCKGTPVRFVILRRKTFDKADDAMDETSSSGVSSSPQSPSE